MNFWPQTARFADLVFERPERLWFAIPILLILALAPLARGGRPAGLWPALLLRSLLLAALLAVLLQPVCVDQEKVPGHVVVLADVSASVGSKGIAEERAYLARAAVAFDLFSFGARPRLVAERTMRPELAPDPGSGTDIGEALRFAELREAGRGPLRILLLSDGRSTVPGAARAALALRRSGVELFAVGVPASTAPRPPAVTLTGIEVPPPADRRAPFRLLARVRAGGPRHAKVLLAIDGEVRRKEEVDVAAGESAIAFDGVSLSPGRHDVQVLVEGGGGRSFASIDVPAIPRVLCLAAAKREVLVARALRTQGMHVEVAGAGEERDYAPFDAIIILPDAPADALQTRAAALANFVGRRGGGLLAIGGSEGPGLARLHGSPVSFLLPLELPQRPKTRPAPPPSPSSKQPRIEIKEEEKPAYPITLCLVIDRSGSMRGPKLERAKRAAAAAAYALTPHDRIAVVAFADRAEVVVRARPAGDPAGVARTLASLRAEGQTSMYQALQLAHALLRKEPSPIRHLVLISDGLPTDEGPWRDLITTMAREKITLSSVGIGFNIDKWLLSRFAGWGHGKYWSANHPHEIPQVVTQDTRMLVQARRKRGRDAERQRPKPAPKKPPPPPPAPPSLPPPPAPLSIVADPVAPREMLLGIKDADLPRVAGVEEGRPRFATWIAARAGKTDGPPLLAYWRVGLGTAAVLAIDPEAAGGAELRKSKLFPRLMGQLLRSILPDVSRAPLVLRHTFVTRDDEERLVLRAVAEDGLARTDLPVEVLVGGRPVEVTARAGRYEARLPRRHMRSRLTVRVGDPESPLACMRLILPVSPSLELAATGLNRAALLRLVTNPDHLDPPPEQVFAPPVGERERRRPLVFPFLLLAAILLPLDAWARRRARSGSR